MKTSYFAHPNILKTDLKLISVSKKPPTWFTKNIQIYRLLCPSWDLVMSYKNNSISEEEYVRRYYEENLNKLDPEKVYHDLGEDSVLLCYEKSGQFCHRHIIGRWLMNSLNIIVMEL